MKILVPLKMIELDEVEYEVSKSVEESLVEIREELKEINKMFFEFLYIS